MTKTKFTPDQNIHSDRVNQDEDRHCRAVPQAPYTPDVSNLKAKIHGQRQVPPEHPWKERSGQDRQKGRQRSQTDHRRTWYCQRRFKKTLEADRD